MRNGALTSGPVDERGDNGGWRLTASGTWCSGRSTVSSPGGGVGCTSSATPLFGSHRRGRAARYGSTLIQWPTHGWAPHSTRRRRWRPPAVGTDPPGTGDDPAVSARTIPSRCTIDLHGCRVILPIGAEGPVVPHGAFALPGERARRRGFSLGGPSLVNLAQWKSMAPSGSR